jgi:hypothetical protein
MNPNEAYQLMMDAWHAGNRVEAYEHADDLRVWLAGGGFPPDARDARHHIEEISRTAEMRTAGQRAREDNDALAMHWLATRDNRH